MIFPVYYRHMAMNHREKLTEFQQCVLVHLDAAHNYAFWLTRNSHDAEDLTQEACARAFAAFDKFERQNPKAWLMTIVRHTFLNQRAKALPVADVIYLDTINPATSVHDYLLQPAGPEQLLQQHYDQQAIRAAIEQLAPDFREVIILRELEDLSYSDIAAITQCAMGTVMSRLSRARAQLKTILQRSLQHMENHA